MTPPKSPRAQTDECLHAERAGADATREQARVVIKVARERARVVLERARARAVALLAEDPERDAEQVEADRQLAAEYKEADRHLTAETPATAEGRLKTDDALSAERAVTDSALDTRDTFMAAVSHDLRAFLSGISLSAAVLAKIPLEGQTRGRVHREVDRIDRSVRRMNRLIDDLLDVVAIEFGVLTVNTKLYDAVKLLNEVESTMHPLAEAREVKLAIETAEKTMVVRLDYERIIEVFVNLITNALKHAQCRTIRLCAEARPGEAVFKVVDDGVGIPTHIVYTIFDRFSRGHRGDRRGLGLGLYISKSIIDTHGGRMGVKSQPGKGTTFQFSVPMDGTELVAAPGVEPS